MKKIGWFTLLCILSFVTAGMSDSAFAKTTVNAKESKQVNGKRKIATTQKLVVTEVVERLGIKNSSDYALTPGAHEDCLEGKLRVRGLEDGSISIMIGERVLVFDVVEGEAEFDNSERDCQIIVKTHFKGSQISFQENYKCKKQKPFSTKKLLSFSKAKDKSILEYTISVIEGRKSQQKIKCRLESQ